MAGASDIGGPVGEVGAGWSRLLAGADALVWELDAGGRLVRVNAALTRVVGAQGDAVRDRQFVEVVHAEDRDEVAAVIASLPARPGELVALRGRLVGPGAAVTWFAGQAMFDAQLARTVALAHDVTARVQAEEAAARERAGAAQAIADAEARLVDISDHTPAAVYVKDLEGRYLFVNRGFEATFGRRRAEVVGRTDREVLPGSMLEAFAAGEQQVRELGVAVETEELLASPGESPRTFSWVRFPLRRDGGGSAGTCGIGADTTPRKQAETALVELGESLERRIAERTAAAEDASRAKSEFLARMSHELRTPLNAILGYSELIEDEMRERGQAPWAADVLRIRSAGKHLLGLINDILDISKIEAGKMLVHIEEFAVQALIEDVITAVRPTIERNRNVLRVDVDPAAGTMRSDTMKIRQCLLNLLSNAGKFTSGGSVSLQVRRHVVNARMWVLFVVTDTGIGIGPEHVNQLFREFYQVDSSSTRRYEGTGLGLVITQRLCHMLGGEIRVSSRAGQGSTFTIELPAVHIEAGAPEVALELEVLAERDVARARMAVRELCQRLGARPLALQKIATVVSELARNMVLYAGGGKLVVGSVGTDKKCMFVRAIDEGAGIPELDAILAGRKVSRNGRGLGLIGTKRLADGFRIHTGPTGTWIEVEVNL